VIARTRFPSFFRRKAEATFCNSVASAFRRKLLLATGIYAAVVFVAVGPASRPASGYAEGAPGGFSGGFGEQSCDGCHFESPLNAKPGSLAIGGVPERFTAGERYTLTVTLSRPSMAIAGFQLAARFENGGAQAGSLAPAPGEEKRVKVETQTNVQYANQRLDGSAPGPPGTVKWSIVWTAPATGGTVVIHAAGNAADKDGTTRGDFVYTTAATSRPQ
jgi:hypothetical protein